MASAMPGGSKVREALLQGLRLRWIHTKLEGLLLGLAGLLVLLLVVEETPRVLFPWDLRVFSESPFLTSMLKLSAGQGMFTDPADSNSFIYSPGLAYLAYGLLRPLHAELDIRACRLVTVVVGFAAAVAAGRICGCLVGSGERGGTRFARLFGAAIAVLIIFTNYTADACHPDNLHALHAMVLIVATSATVESGSFPLALATLVLAAAGLLAKQNAVFGLLGAAGVITVFGWKRWGALRTLLALVWGLVWLAGAAWVVFGGWGLYWALEVAGRPPIQWFRLHVLFSQWTVHPHRALISAVFIPCAALLWARHERARKVLVVWVAIGLTEVLPAIGAYLKVWGFWNNLVIIDLWMALPVIAVGVHYVGVDRDEKEPATQRAVAAGALVTLLISLVPLRASMSPRP